MTSSNASARVAVDNRGERGSVMYQSVVDAMLADEEVDDFDDSPPPTRRVHRLSIEDKITIKRASVILTHPMAQRLVLTNCETTRLQRLQEKLFHRPPGRRPSRYNSATATSLPKSRKASSYSTVRSLDDVRRWLRIHIKTQVFRSLLYTVVLCDVVALAADEKSGDASTPYVVVDVLCTLLLFLEIVLKSFAFGLFQGPNAYFSRSKRVVRFLNVLTLVLSLASFAGGYKWRILRGLKTFRCLTLYAGLRRILRSLARAIPFLANVGTLALFFLFAFSIFGLEAYRGSYDKQCRWDFPQEANNQTYWAALPRKYCSSNSSCVAPSHCASVPPPSSTVNFDSGLSALFMVFVVVAQDGWVADIMQPVVEASGVWSSLFFVAIVASMVFLVVNLFVAVITTSFMNFTVESNANAAGASGDDTARTSEGDDDEDGREPMRGAMIKMDPEDEDTRVSLIMGATLAIEETIQLQHQKTTGASELAAVDASTATGRGDKTIKSILARTHKYHSLRNLAVDATLDLIHTAASVEELLSRATAGEAPGTNGVDATGVATARPTTSPRRLTRLQDARQPFSSLKDVLSNASHPWFLSFQKAVLSKRFDDCITGCIAVNTAFLLVEYRGMPSWVQILLSITENIFAAIFLLEMVARIIAMRGIRRYLHSTERCFDMVVVMCTSLNIVLNAIPSITFSGLNSVSSLRTLRVTRLMMKWEGTRKLIESVVKSSRGVVDVVVFLILFQVVSSIVAMQLFGGNHLSSDGETPRWNFDTFPRAFLTLLQVITADQWSSITYDAVNADDPHSLLVPFLMINFIIGQYVLLNLFIAVILENFAITEEEAYQLQLEQIIAIPKELDIYEKIEEEGVRAFGEMEQLDNVSNVKLRMFLGLDAKATDQHNGSNERSGVYASFSGDRRAARHRPNAPAAQWVRAVRTLCRRVMNSTPFHRTVQLMILVSCFTLILDDPHPETQAEPPDERLQLALSICNRMALGVFAIEFLVKVGACGFGFEYLRMVLFHRDEQLGYVKKQAYMEDRWNQLDLFLLVLTIADEVIAQVDDSFRIARMFRAGRVLRPLRILNHNHEMKMILSAVAQSLPHVGNVFALCAIVYIIFGVVGRSLFSGMFYACNDPSVTTMDACVGFFRVEPDGALALQEASAKSVRSGEILIPRVWSNARFSFDDIGSAFLALLEMTSLKWIDKAFAAMDITGVNKQPQQDHAPQNAVFFVLFVYIGSLFVIRLFVGVLVEQFQRNNGTQILTESQKSWVDLEKFVLLLKPLKRIPRPRHTWANAVYDLCQHRYFGRTVAVVILLNVALLLFNPSSSSASSTETESTSFKVIEVLFLCVFLMEAMFKCVAFRHHYILSSAGAFELLILGGSLAAYFLATGIHGLIQAGRVFRMMRVLRFVRLNRGVYAVFQTFRASIKPIGHIFFLLFMIFFIFAVVGRQLFGGVRLGSSLNRFSNFRTFGSSFLLLFQVMAGDDWHLTMTDCMQSKPFCVERHDDEGKYVSDCGNAFAAVAFFVTYVTLVVFFLLNLFIAVVLENFRSCYLQGDVCPISLHDFESYREVFMQYDLDNKGTFPLWQLDAFLQDLPPGLRVDRKQNRTAFLQIRSQVQALQEVWAEHRCKRPFFNELLRALCIHHLGIRALPYEQQRDRVKQIFIYRAKVADMLVESAVKGYVQRWRLRKEREKLAKMRSKMVPEVALVRRLSEGGRRHSAASCPNLPVVMAPTTTTDASVPVVSRVGGLAWTPTLESATNGPTQTDETGLGVDTTATTSPSTTVATVATELDVTSHSAVDETSDSTSSHGHHHRRHRRHRRDKHHRHRQTDRGLEADDTTDDHSNHTKRKKPRKTHKKSKHQADVVTPQEGDGTAIVDIVRKCVREDEPLHAPRRHHHSSKIVPT